jgi:hypothetical protein
VSISIATLQAHVILAMCLHHHSFIAAAGSTRSNR